jgi:hypothetical protein
MNSAILLEIEKKIDLLSPDQQLWLIEQIVRRLRETPLKNQGEKENQLAAMAADPEIQQELRKIEEEFAPTEKDGLGNI